MIQFYDYSLDTYLNATIDLVNNGSVALSTLQSHVSRILGVKYDLGLFENKFIPEAVNSQTLTEQHVPLTLEAAQKSIVLLENRKSILPLRPVEQNISKIALVGPFLDSLNYVRLHNSSYHDMNLCTSRVTILANMAPTQRRNPVLSANPCSNTSLPMPQRFP